MGLAPGTRSVRVGEACMREVAASLLDHGRWARVPRTALVRIDHPRARFHSASPGEGGGAKLGSLQAYARHDYDASEHGTSRFPASEVHKLGVLDLRLYSARPPRRLPLLQPKI